MIGERPGQVVAKGPPHAVAIGDSPQELAFGAQPLHDLRELTRFVEVRHVAQG
jgi:hypothetical protein